MLPIICAIEAPEDRDLMAEFYEKYRKLLYLEAGKYLDITEDVDDIVLDGIAKIIDKMDIFRTLQERQQVQYAVTTVRNLSINYLRRSKRTATVPLEVVAYELPAQEGLPDVIAEGKSVARHIRSIMDSLPVADRQLLEQKYILQWSDQELAASLGIKPQSVRMYLSRSKRKLLALLQKNGINPLD